MKVEGKWIGQYTYGREYPANVVGKSIAFEMDVFSRGIEFYGDFTDDETRNLFDKKGTVEGFLEGNFITFNKRYPKSYQIAESGTIEILENAIAPLIKYEGAFSNDQFIGEWEIHHYYMGEDGTFSIITGTGTWTMEKAIPQ